MAFESNFELALSTPSLPSISAPAEVVVQGDLVMENAPRQRINPQYPRRAQQRKIEGYVIVEFRVDEEGRVDRDSLEFVEANPEGIFERVVRKAVFRWRFDPLMQNGVAVAYKNRQRFEFNLEN
jgi:protein TonB